LEHLRVKAIFGRKKNSSQNQFQKWRFFGNLRVYILTVDIGTPKRYILGQNAVFWRIFRKNPFRGVGCSELQEPNKALKTSPQMVRKITYMGSKDPRRERDKMWHAD